MVNSGATVNFVNVSWLSNFAWESVWELGLQICALDGRTIISKNEFKVCTFDIMIEQLPLTKLSAITASCVNYDVILGTSWLHTVNSDIDWKLWMMISRITWESPLGFIEEPSEPSVPLVEKTLKAPVKDPPELTQTLVVITLKSPVNDHLKWNQALVKFALKSSVYDHSELHPDLVKIPLKVLKDSENYVLDLNAVDYADYLNDEFFFLMYSHCLTEQKVIFAATSVFFNTGKPLVTDEDWEVPEVYWKFTDVFFKGKAETLLKFRGSQVDHVIELTLNFKVFNKSVYNHSEKELQVQRDYISENIIRDWIQVSKSSVFSPCMFTAKKNIMNLHLVVDYRSLNTVTVKNRYPLPLIDTLLNRLEGVKYFTRLNLRNAYHLIRIREGDEWKTAFKTQYGLYEYTVMPFDLINASVTFQVYIDQVLTGMIDTELIAFLNDILIFESTWEECRKCTLKALQRLKDAKLFCKKLKCLFKVTSVDFLDFIMRNEEIVMNLSRVSMIIEWSVPQNLREVRAFIDFTEFYRRFIKEYFKVAQGMTDLMKKISSPFVWTPEADNCFYVMKQLFIKASVLKQFDLKLSIFVETDAFKFTVSDILSQKHNDHCHPVEFFFKKLGSAEQNYRTSDQELLAVYLLMMHWRHHLERVNHKVIVLSDHKNLIQFNITANLNWRQLKWFLDLQWFNFKVQHRLSNKNPADRSFCRSDYDIKEELSVDNFLTLAAMQIPVTLKGDLIEALIMNSLTVTLTEDLLNSLQKQWVWERDMLFWEEKIYVSESLQLRILKEGHDYSVSGHYSQRCTEENLHRNYYWSNMQSIIREYIRGCQTCQQAKADRHTPYGTLALLPVLKGSWTRVSIDFITDLLTESTGNDSILQIIDSYTKMAHMVPVRLKGPPGMTLNAEGAVILLRKHVVRPHGILKTWVSDWDARFINKFWKHLCRRLGIKHVSTTAYYSQGDGQTERLNQSLEAYLRVYVNWEQNDWEKWLNLTEMTYNNFRHDVTGTSPFFTNYECYLSMKVLWELLRELLDELRATAHADHMTELYQTLITCLIKINRMMSCYYDQHHQVKEFEVDNFVWLRIINICTRRPFKKLNFKKAEPFRITEKIDTWAYWLKLSDTMKIHNVFFIGLLETYIPPQDGQNSFREGSVLIDGEAEWEVSGVIDSKIDPECSFLYLIHWEGPWDDTWESLKSLWNTSEVLEAFHRSCPDKLKLKACKLSLKPLNNEKDEKGFWADWVLSIYPLTMCLNVSSMQLFITKFIFKWATFCIQKVPSRPLHDFGPGLLWGHSSAEERYC